MGGRLKAALQEAGLRQRAVAEHFGVTEQAVSQWARNETVPDMGKLFALAKLLGVRAEWIVAKSGERYPMQPQGESLAVGQAVPVIDRVQAGQWTEVPENQDTETKYIFVEVESALSPNAFALQISGASMLPEFRPGDIVIIDPAVEPNPGDFVVAKLEHREAATFKKYRPKSRDGKGREAFELVPLNQDWNTLEVGPKNHGRVIGTMVEHRRYRAGRRPRLFGQDATEE